MLSNPSFLYFLLAGLVSLPLWIKMVGILKANGIKTSYYIAGPWQFMDFHDLIKKETNERVRTNYKWLLYTQLFIFALYIPAMIYFIG